MKTTLSRAQLAVCRRNGRECADAAVAFEPLPWTPEHYQRCLDDLARALAMSYPGDFLISAQEILDAARTAFDERLAEIGPVVGSSSTGRA